MGCSGDAESNVMWSIVVHRVVVYSMVAIYGAVTDGI